MKKLFLKLVQNLAAGFTFLGTAAESKEVQTVKYIVE